MDIANLVQATAGREQGKYFFVLETDGEYLLLADGKSRRIEAPKRKKQKHVRFIAESAAPVAEKIRSKEMCTVRMCTAFSTKKKLPSGSWKHLQRIRELPWSRFTVSITRHSKRHSTIFSQMRCASIST